MGKAAQPLKHLSIPLEIRDLIDEVVHTVIAETYRHFPQGLESRCAIYAIVGARTLSLLTGSPYNPVCGAQLIPLADGTPYVLCPAEEDIQTAIALHQLRDYHCWIESVRGDKVEVVDFTLRHSNAASGLLGLVPLIGTDETYAWVCIPSGQIANAQPNEVHFFASCLKGHFRLTQLLNAMAKENDRLFEFLTQHCLTQIQTGLLALETLLRRQALDGKAEETAAPIRDAAKASSTMVARPAINRTQ